MRLLSIILILLTISSGAFAQQQEAGILKSIINNAAAKEPEAAKAHLTEESQTLFDRIYKYDLMHVLPSNILPLEKQTQNGYSYVKFYDTASKSGSASILAFKPENSTTKLDLPETFRVGFGENWQQTLDMIEQTYVMGRKYYGEEKSRQLVEVIIKQTKPQAQKPAP
jgi:hypothetical protein